jgi:hypothetical protein
MIIKPFVRIINLQMFSAAAPKTGLAELIIDQLQ